MGGLHRAGRFGVAGRPFDCNYDPEHLAARHRQLLEALKTRDPAKAMRAMQHHIEDLGKPPKDLELENA